MTPLAVPASRPPSASQGDAPSPERPRPAALLAALTPYEAQDFLPEPLLGEVRRVAGRYAGFDPTDISPEQFERLLARENPEILLTCWKTPPLPATLPPRLRYVCHLAGSVRHLVPRRHIADGLLVSNWGGSISRIVAEWALFHILSCLRRATYWTLAMHREDGWKNVATETASLFGRKVGLHGFGQIARELLRLLQPFGCRISAHAPDVDAETARRHGIAACPTLEDLFAENDIVVELAPLIPETAGCVTERHLRLLKPGSVFVNVGRGAVVDEEALVRVAREGKVLFGLDVFRTEPLPPDHSLRSLVNVSLTPHIGGPTTDRRRDAGAFALRNLRAYAAGTPLEAVVTPEVYDRSS
jgi:phosphoglycerate dehydrogenase-like enzyme